MKIARSISAKLLLVLLALTLVPVMPQVAAAQEKQPKAPAAPGPMLHQGTIDIDTPDFTLSLVGGATTTTTTGGTGTTTGTTTTTAGTPGILSLPEWLNRSAGLVRLAHQGICNAVAYSSLPVLRSRSAIPRMT